MRVLIALSGGVDSSVAAHLLHNEGHELIGVRFHLWSDPLAPAIEQLLPSKCCNTQTIARARSIAESLRIPFHEIDLSKEFKEHIVDPFLSDYAQGLTPNPCIQCNRSIKFGMLVDIARTMKCDALATGHYARVTSDINDASMTLLEAIDKSKDQSYYLYGLSQEQLSFTRFPLGGMMKSDVFSLAKTYNISLPDEYQESQDLCFFPEKDPHDFLDRYLSPQKGTISDAKGNALGEHRGLPHYTEGQRRGIGVGGARIPLHVVRKDIVTNTLVVGPLSEAMQSEVHALLPHWISRMPPSKQNYKIEARIHSHGIKRMGTLYYDEQSLKFTFDMPILGASPGQSIVFYDGEKIIGGAIIASPSEISPPSPPRSSSPQ